MAELNRVQVALGLGVVSSVALRGATCYHAQPNCTLCTKASVVCALQAALQLLSFVLYGVEGIRLTAVSCTGIKTPISFPVFQRVRPETTVVIVLEPCTCNATSDFKGLCLKLP